MDFAQHQVAQLSIKFKKSALDQKYHFFCIPLTLIQALCAVDLAKSRLPQHQIPAKINTCSQPISY